MATASHGLTGSDVPEPLQFAIGELAGREVSPEPNWYDSISAEGQPPAQLLTELEVNALKYLNGKATRRDYPARLVEVIQSWEAALFYRGFQFLIPERGGGWRIPGESTGYGPSMQLDLALLPTNIYSAQAQILIATLTRGVPGSRFEPQNASDAKGITAAESAEKFTKVIKRNNPLMRIQTDASRYLYCDGRFHYYSRYCKDGQLYGWEEEDAPELVPETEPPAAAPAATQGTPAPEAGAPSSAAAPEEGQEETQAPPAPKRTPRGQERRTAHGKLEVKLSPMSANEQSDVDSLQYETEISAPRAKGRFPEVAAKIKAGSTGISEGEISKLARQNVKLGMQSTYVTSDSIADDVTIQMNWHRPSQFMDDENIKPEVRDSLIEKFPDGVLCVMAGSIMCYARNESMDDCWALGQAFSGDGQNRNALGTSMMPIQKRVNNWLDLMNDYFIRTVPKKWMHNKAFDVETLRKQTNVPGDIGAVKPQAGFQSIRDLIFVEEQVAHNPSLPEFVKEYIGPISQLLSGAYPALAGMEEGDNPTARGKQIQRDQALGRLGPTWHSIQEAEANSMRQLVRWGAKCRDGSINERIPGGETIRLEVNDLKGNILCYPEADSSFPETHSDKEAKLDEILENSAKNPEMLEELFNPANLEFFAEVKGMANDLYFTEIAAYNKQLGELELLTQSKPLPNPKLEQAGQTITAMESKGVDPTLLLQAKAEMQNLPPEVSTIPVEPWEDHASESFGCRKFLMSPEGRKLKKNNRPFFNNVVLHMDEHDAALAQKQGQAQTKPPSESINLKDVPTPEGQSQLLAKGGITVPPSAIKAQDAQDEAKEAMKRATATPEPIGAGR